jgi:hypothetical protein
VRDCDEPANNRDKTDNQDRKNYEVEDNSAELHPLSIRCSPSTGQ